MFCMLFVCFAQGFLEKMAWQCATATQQRLMSADWKHRHTAIVGVFACWKQQTHSYSVCACLLETTDTQLFCVYLFVGNTRHTHIVCVCAAKFCRAKDYCFAVEAHMVHQLNSNVDRRNLDGEWRSTDLTVV